MKITPSTWIILALIGVIIFLILTANPKPTDEAVLQARDSIKQITALNTIILRAIEAKDIALKKALEAEKTTEKRFNEEIQKPKTTTTILRPQIQPLSDSIPVLREFIAAQDETIELQSARIDTLSREKAFQTKLYEDLIVLKDSLLSGKDQIIAQQVVIIVTQEKELRKARQKEKLAKVLISVVAAGALILGSQL